MRRNELFAGAEVPAGARQRWRPTRLLLVNWWRFAEEEIHFAHGHLVLRGANGSGKSTILASALPMLLDGRKDRMDPFGSRSRSVSYYLLGDPEATEEHDFYHEQRTGYLALEVTDGHRYRTVGIGMYASRNRAGSGVDSWYFTLEDGRRIGRDFSLTDSRRIPLTLAQLRERVGEGGMVVQEVRAFQEMVNRLFFGFERMEEFHDLMNTLLLLRSPKLSRDIKPSLVAQTLRDSLPPLDEEILGQVTRIIQRLDQHLAERERTAADRSHTAALTEVEARYFLLKGRRAAAAFLEAHHRAEEGSGQVRSLEGQIATVEEGIRQAQAEERQAEGELLRLRGELATLEGSEALKTVGAMQDLRNQAGLEREGLSRLEEEQKRERQRLEREESKARSLTAEAAKRRRFLQEGARKSGSQAGEIRWPYGNHWFDSLAKALDDTAGVLPAVETDSLTAAAASRREALGALEVALGQVARTETHHAEQYRHLQWETDRLTAIADQVRVEEGRLEEARTALRASLQEWQEGLGYLECSDVRLAAMVRLAKEEGPHAPARVAWELFEEQREEGRQRQEELLRQLHRAEADLQAAEATLTLWEEQGEPVPPVSLERSRARRRLGEAGIAAQPLYRLVRPRRDLPQAAAARLEGALRESGLLDALVVPREAATAVRRLLREEELAESWIRPAGEEARGLERWLQPETDGGTVAVADIEAALRAIDLSGWGASLFEPDGTWQVGPVAGTSTPAPEIRYLGADSRQRYFREERERRQRTVEEARQVCGRLEQEAAAWEIALSGAEREARAVAELPAIPEVNRALAARAAMAAQEAGQQDRCRLAEQRTEAAWQQVQVARAVREQRWEELPETRDLDQDGVREWRQTVDALARQGLGLAERLGDLKELVGTLRDLEEAMAERRQAIVDREQEGTTRGKRLLKLQAQISTLQQLLESEGRTAQELLQRVEALRQAEEHQGRLRDSLLQKRSGLEGKLEPLQGQMAGAIADQERREKERVACRTSLEELLGSHPALSGWREAIGQEGPVAACRRQVAGGTSLQLAEEEERARHALADAYYQRQTALQEYRPELDGESGRLTFRLEGRQLGAPDLLARLETDLQDLRLMVEEKEQELYQEIVLKEVSHALREEIQRAHHWVDRINLLLAEHALGSGEVLSLVLRPRRETPAFGGRTGVLLELLARDARLLSPRDQETLTGLFRDEVNRLRQEEKSGSLTLGFEPSLALLFDYRLWFEFALRSQPPGGPRVDLTDARFGTRSGAEKSLAVFIPLLAAVTARFDSARSDAVRLIGMDEAFAGVDEVNTQRMFRFLTELDCDFIMTSEKLWGVGPGLTGCATWEIQHQDNVPLLLPSRWDGQALLALAEAAAAGEGDG